MEHSLILGGQTLITYSSYATKRYILLATDMVREMTFDFKYGQSNGLAKTGLTGPLPMALHVNVNL